MLFLLKLVIILPIRKLAIKVRRLLSQTRSIKSKNSYSQVDQFVCTPSIYHGLNERRRAFYRQDTKQNVRFIERKNGNPSTKPSNLNYLDHLNELELNIPYYSKAVSVTLIPKVYSYIKTAAKYKNL